MLENVIAGAQNAVSGARREPIRTFDAEYSMPTRRQGIVVIADGSAACQSNPRNRLVARLMRERGLGTLLVDVLSGGAGAAIEGAVASLEDRAPVGLFGIADGIEGAVAASQRVLPSALVLRGTVPDAALQGLSALETPTLLIVGAHNLTGLRTGSRIHYGSNVRELEIVPGTGDSFEEPGTLVASSLCACNWFREFFVPMESRTPLGVVAGPGDR